MWLDSRLAVGHAAVVRDEWRERCPNLFQLLGACLHQDFDLEYDSAESALIDAIESQSKERLEQALMELAMCRPPADDEAASEEFTRSMCDYHPPGDGMTYSAWLDHVQNLLSRATSR